MRWAWAQAPKTSKTAANAVFTRIAFTSFPLTEAIYILLPPNASPSAYEACTPPT
ncbi:hypothetical protein TthSNM66_19880 [Thermus thermophilus]|nr:hypothetical protein TthSNM66_19880 [Thermus thermophilus]